MDLGGPQGGPDPAPSVPLVQGEGELLGGVAVPGAGELVCQGGSPLHHRPLAARGQFLAANGRGRALGDWQAGAMADLAALLCGGGSEGEVPSEPRHGPSVAGQCRPGGQEEGAGPTGRGGDFWAGGDGWAVGAAAQGAEEGGVSPCGHGDRGDLAAGGCR